MTERIKGLNLSTNYSYIHIFWFPSPFVFWNYLQASRIFSNSRLIVVRIAGIIFPYRIPIGTEIEKKKNCLQKRWKGLTPRDVTDDCRSVRAASKTWQMNRILGICSFTRLSRAFLARYEFPSKSHIHSPVRRSRKERPRDSLWSASKFSLLFSTRTGELPAADRSPVKYLSRQNTSSTTS